MRFLSVKPIDYACACIFDASARTTGMCMHARIALSQHPEVKPTMPAVAVEAACLVRTVQIALQDAEIYPEGSTQLAALYALAARAKERLVELLKPRHTPAPEPEPAPTGGGSVAVYKLR